MTPVIPSCFLRCCVVAFALMGRFLPAFAADPDTELESLRKTIAAQNERYLETLKNGDAEGHAALFCEDGMILVPGVPNLVGRQQIFYDKRAKFESVRVLEGAILSTHLERSGDLAHEIGTFSYTFEAAGRDPLTVTGKYLVIWKRQEDGSWKIQVDSGLPD